MDAQSGEPLARQRWQISEKLAAAMWLEMSLSTYVYSNKRVAHLFAHFEGSRPNTGPEPNEQFTCY
jgi:hypothetical protein